MRGSKYAVIPRIRGNIEVIESQLGWIPEEVKDSGAKGRGTSAVRRREGAGGVVVVGCKW